MNNAYAALQWLFDKQKNPFSKLQGVALIDAKPHSFLKGFDRPLIVQGFFPDFSALEKAGFEVLAELGDRALSGAVLFGSKHKEENLFFLAKLANRLEENAPFIAVAANDLGGKSLAKNAARLFGGGGSESKYHHTLFTAQKKEKSLDRALQAAWLKLGEPKTIEGGYQTVPGIFCHDAIDTGSRLLDEALQTEPIGQKVADLGAGWGYLSGELLKRNTKIESITLFEADYAAIKMARQNVADARAAFLWCDVTAGTGENRFDTILCNPPFHRGGLADTGLGQAFIRAAYEALKPGGTLYLVANRHLPYEAVLNTYFKSFRPLADRQGFKVIAAKKASRPA